MTCANRTHGTRSLFARMLLFAGALQFGTTLELSAQARSTTWDSASVRAHVELPLSARDSASARMGRATGGGLLLGATLGALAGFGVGLYACAQASEGAICLPGYVITTAGAAAGFLVTLVIMTARS